MPPPVKPAEVPIGNSVFVSKLGDASGLRTRLDKCFLDIPAAVATAVPGDTVFVFPGVHALTTPIPIRPGVNFEFLGAGAVTSAVNVFSDKGQVGDSDNIILARGWKFSSANGQVLEFAPLAANRKASLFFTFDTLSGGEPVMIYAGAGRIVLDGNAILAPDGTPVQINAALDATIRNCLIKTDTLGNHDAILLAGNLTVENCRVEARGGNGGTDAIGMDDGKLVIRNSKVVSEGANALTVRAAGTVEMSNSDITGDDAALIAADGLIVESDGCNFHCTGTVGAAVETYRNSPAKINLRGGRISSVEGGTDIRVGGAAGEITVAGTTWDRAKGLPTREWIPGTGWQ